MTAEGLFLAWPEVVKRSEGRRVVLYGRSEDWVHKAVSKLPDVLGIIDRNVRYHGQEYLGIPIMDPGAVHQIENAFFIITASEFHAISDLLEENGFIPGKDFCCSPDFRSYARLGFLESLRGEVLFSSSDYLDKARARGSSRGGGMYRLDLETGHIELLYAGSIRQFVGLPDGRMAAVDFVANHLLVLSPQFEVEALAAIPSANACGVAFSEQHNSLLVADAGKDCIYIFDSSDLTLLRVFQPFGRGDNSPTKHHLNDLTIRGEEVYFSYFSASGEYKSGVFDGGVSRVNYLTETNTAEQVLGGLYKPHSPIFIDGELFVADSMTGSVKRGRHNLARFPGFIRGLDGLQGLLAAGQSSDMYLLDRDPELGTTVINSGLYLMSMGLDGVREARFYATPGLTNIHDVAIIRVSR